MTIQYSGSARKFHQSFDTLTTALYELGLKYKVRIHYPIWVRITAPLQIATRLHNMGHLVNDATVAFRISNSQSIYAAALHLHRALTLPEDEHVTRCLSPPPYSWTRERYQDFSVRFQSFMLLLQHQDLAPIESIQIPILLKISLPNPMMVEIARLQEITIQRNALIFQIKTPADIDKCFSGSIALQIKPKLLKKDMQLPMIQKNSNSF